MIDTTTPAEAPADPTRRCLTDGASPTHLAELHRRLEREAEAAADLDIAYTTVDSPVGRLLLAATAVGLVRVAFDAEGHDAVLDTLATRISPRILRAPARLDAAARELDAYFAHRLERFDVALDRRLSRGFRLTVQDALPSIGYGETASYAVIAERVGNRGATRAVGTACATNPLPIVIPCHRVVRSDGSLGGYVGGLEAKTRLLDLERA